MSFLLDAALGLAHRHPSLRKPVVAAAVRALFGPRVRVARFVDPKPRPSIHGLEFNDELFEWLWWEDEHGNRLRTTTEQDEKSEFPPNAHTQHSQFPHVLRHSVFLMEGGGEAAAGESSWSDDVVTAMVRSGDWTAQDAIMVYAQGCERCINVLAHTYLGPGEGYAFGSDDYWSCNTCCSMCLPIAGDPHPNGPRDVVTPAGDS